MTRRYLIPEVVQTSAMDCGPAALKAIAGGFGVYLSYGRLREACQTNIDGTSIDALEEVAALLGLSAEQGVLPADLIALECSACLPAIAVTRLADGGTHFVVVWRMHGRWVQIMDPAAGRLWMPRQRFLDSLYQHEQKVRRAACDEWTRSQMFVAGLEQRMRSLGLPAALWSDPAHQDAALRLAGALHSAGELARGEQARTFLALCAESAEEIPPAYWLARPSGSDPDQVILRGAVLLTIAGRRSQPVGEGLPEALHNVLHEPPPRTWAPVWSALRQDGWLWPGAIGSTLLLAAIGVVLEALLFRGFFDLARHLDLKAQRLAAGAALLVFLGTLLALEWPATLGLFRMGRHLELRLRVQFLLKIPMLGDRYFQSRLISDMAYRAHWLQTLRQLPEAVGQLLRLLATLAITAVAIGWLFPGSAVLAWLAVVVACGVPFLFLPAMAERDLRIRETSASLSRFYLDAMLASVAIRVHGAQRNLRTAQALQLNVWANAELRRQALIVRAEVVQMTLTLVPVIYLVWRHATTVEDPATLLLLVYWAVSIPLLGRDIALLGWTLPVQRNTLLRFLEPLGTPQANSGSVRHEPGPVGVDIELRDVTVIVGGHVVLDAVSLEVRAGEHVGIVGASGAGKSSLVGLLLGWYECASGSINVDGTPFDATRFAQLRHQTAWVDPQVHLFRVSLLDNLCYGNGGNAASRIGSVIADTGLDALLARLPRGLQTPLGDGGALVSGGEGQAVRMGRALARPGVRLAVLDEAARGLDRRSRRRYLAKARSRFVDATMLFVSHDIADTLRLDRVFVIEKGRVVEQGRPQELRHDASSRYRALLDGERTVGRALWRHPAWRRLVLHAGVLVKSDGTAT